MAVWYDLTFAYKELLTYQKMNELDGNFDALAEGSSGAPKIQTAALEQTDTQEAVTRDTIRAGAVGNNEISVTTTKIPNLNADLLDDKDTGNDSGDIPISNGVLNTNLNADMLDGKHEGFFIGFSMLWFFTPPGF